MTLKKLVYLVIVFFFLVSCKTSTPQALPTVDVGGIQTLAVETVLAGANLTATANAPTNTTTPTLTTTNTPTPTITPTQTLTPTPFNTSGCIDMEINISIPNENFLELLLSQRGSYDTKCVRLVYSPEYGYFSPNSIFSVFEFSDDGPRGKLDIVKDEGMQSPNKYSYVWGIFQGPSTLFLKRVDELPKNQYPIKDGLHAVGSNGEIAPGFWKSSAAPTETNSCYWARINSGTGEIIDNHFGIAGIKVQIYEGDIFEIEGCGIWFYVSP